MKTTGQELRRSEWDFRPLTPRSPTRKQWRELNAAICYEYGRESVSLRKLAAEYSTLPDTLKDQVEERCSLSLLGGHPTATKMSSGLVYFDQIRFWNCIFWPKYFPRTPWLEIPNGERLGRIQQYFYTNPPARVVEINEPQTVDLLSLLQNEPATAELRALLSDRNRRWFTGTGEYMLVRVEYADCNNSDIASAFKELVSKRRPESFPEPRSETSRANVTAAVLNRLAVMRLLNQYSFVDAARLADGQGVTFPIEQREALRMRKRVPPDLREIFLSRSFIEHGLPPLVPSTEFPLRYPTMSGRGR